MPMSILCAQLTMKLSDYVADFLANEGVTHTFGLTGGAVVHLFDSMAKHPRIRPIFAHHEQAAAFAAQAYARIKNGIGAAVVTTGPGGTNAITGVTAAWLDSIPCIYISGQVRLAHTGQGTGLRQVGTQHLDILSLVRPITKYAVLIEKPESIKYHLQKAVHIARSGRPGPVWLDIPLDLQWANIEPSALLEFDPKEQSSASIEIAAEKLQLCRELLRAATRPVLLVGNGVRLARAEQDVIRLIESLRIPFLTTWNVTDLLPSDHPLNIGRPGMFGQRGSNLAIQNCDLLLSLGSHLCVSITGTMFGAFAREAKVVMVDIDADELKHRTVRVDLPIQSDARAFVHALKQLPEMNEPLPIHPWREHCAMYKTRYNGILAEYRNRDAPVNPYVFVDTLSDVLTKDDQIVVDGGGTINQITFQAFRVQAGQRLIISAGLCSMGSGLPESIGACFAGENRRTICLTGDGSLQLNIHELQTLVHHQLPVKIFVLCNAGYVSIRATQQGFLGSNYVGSISEGGVSLPDYGKVAAAYGLKTLRIENHADLAQRIQKALDEPGPVLVEVLASKDDQPMPRQGFDKKPDGTGVPRPLEDMYPYLDRAEFREAMQVAPWSST